MRDGLLPNGERPTPIVGGEHGFHLMLMFDTRGAYNEICRISHTRDGLTHLARSENPPSGWDHAVATEVVRAYRTEAEANLAAQWAAYDQYCETIRRLKNNPSKPAGEGGDV